MLVMGCGHYFNANAPGCETTAVWCGACAQQLQRVNQELANQLVEARCRGGFLGLASFGWAVYFGRHLDDYVKVLSASLPGFPPLVLRT